MDIPAAAGAWIALGVLLGIVLLGLAGLGVALLARRRPAAAADRREQPDEPADDLAAFREHPPGSPGERRRPQEGWAALSAPPPAATVAVPGTPQPPLARRGLVAVAVVAVVLAGAAGGVAAALGDGERRPRTSAPGPPTSERADPPGAGAIEARLAFGGVVLERHAVGVTAAYPELRLAGDRAQLQLPTYNCLADAAPPDPVAAGCRRTVPEYADLAAPELRVTETGGGWEISGRFRTETRPYGGDPVPTGRAYELVVTVVPGGRVREGWWPVEGTLRLGTEEASTTGTDAARRVNVLRSGAR